MTQKGFIIRFIKKKWKIKKTGGEKMYMYWAPLSQKPGPSENQKSKIAKKNRIMEIYWKNENEGDCRGAGRYEEIS